MTDKYITGGTKSGSGYKVYHTKRECIHIKKSDSDRAVSDSEVEWHDMDKCKYCSELEER